MGCKARFPNCPKKRCKTHFFGKKAYQITTVGFLVWAACAKIVPAMSQFNNQPAPKRATKKEKNMKNRITTILVLSLFAACGCNTPVRVSGDYATPKQTIAGAVNATTNSVTVSGAYSTTNQTVGGSVTVGK